MGISDSATRMPSAFSGTTSTQHLSSLLRKTVLGFGFVLGVDYLDRVEICLAGRCVINDLVNTAL